MPLPMRDAEVLFFDIDNTLYDFEGSIRLTLAHLRRVAPEHCADVPLDELERLYWAANGSLPDRLKLALIERDPERYRQATFRAYFEARAKLGLVVPAGIDDAALSLARAFGRWRFDNLRESAFAGSMETLEALSGRYTLGVISNGPSSLQREKLQALGARAHVDESLVFISGEFGEKKPARAIFEAAAAKAGASPERCVMIGDSRECDMPARAIGMRAILFAGKSAPDGFETDPWPPDRVVRDYRALRELLL